MKILVDTNIFLDIFLYREKLYQESLSVIKKAIHKRDIIYISSSSIKDVYYFVNKYTHSRQTSLKAILKLLEIAKVEEVNRNNIIEALSSNINDFEDAIIDSVASRVKTDFILTRNKKDFINANNKVLTPEEYLQQY
ncbi:MAG: PIN domain-containing protein [Erysipelotrichaceae bacterium]|nr:PIN domain-containing protein [Erysipelotrichaceae bacterium]